MLQRSAILVLFPAVKFLAPASLFNCLLQVALTQELETNQKASKGSSSLEKSGKSVHILRFINIQSSQGLSHPIFLIWALIG